MPAEHFTDGWQYPDSLLNNLHSDICCREQAHPGITVITSQVPMKMHACHEEQGNDTNFFMAGSRNVSDNLDA